MKKLVTVVIIIIVLVGVAYFARRTAVAGAVRFDTTYQAVLLDDNQGSSNQKNRRVCERPNSALPAWLPTLPTNLSG